MFQTSMEVIRYAYPNPSSGERIVCTAYDYCVAGAFFLYLGDNWDGIKKIGFTPKGFPCAGEVAFILHKLVGMPEDTARDFAFDIVTANDEMDFDLAWMRLDKALSWKAE